MKKKYSLILSLFPGSFDWRVEEYIKKHNARQISRDHLIDIAINRLQSKSYYAEGIAYIGHFISWLFSVKNVGQSLNKEYRGWLNSLAENSLFCTESGDITLKNIRYMVITPGKKEVHIAFWQRLQYDEYAGNHMIQPIYHFDFPTKKVKASDINWVQIRSSNQINNAISLLKSEFKALPDMMNIINHLYPELDLNTSSLKWKRLKQELDSLSADDYNLLVNMASDILDDIKLIYSNIKIYWG